MFDLAVLTPEELFRATLLATLIQNGYDPLSTVGGSIAYATLPASAQAILATL